LAHRAPVEAGAHLLWCQQV